MKKKKLRKKRNLKKARKQKRKKLKKRKKRRRRKKRKKKRRKRSRLINQKINTEDYHFSFLYIPHLQLTNPYINCWATRILEPQ